MSPQASWILQEEVVPRLRSTIPRAVSFVGCEDAEELIADATVIAARMIISAETNRKQFGGGTIAYYAVQHLKSGRRANGSSSVDVMASATQIKSKSQISSLEETVATDESGNDLFELHDTLSSDTEDPSVIAGRKMDWDLFCEGLSEIELLVVEFLKPPHQLLFEQTHDRSPQMFYITGTDSVLWQQQQEDLARHRQRLYELVKQKLAGAACHREIAATFRMLAGKIHHSEWDSLLPVFDAIARLGSDYHLGFIVFGGWHHAGKPGNLNPPSKDLRALLREYRGLVKAASLCREALKSGRIDWSDSLLELAELQKCVGTYQTVLPGHLWNQPDRLLELVEQREPLKAMEIENVLLFMQPRIFMFSPTAKNRVAGWQDFCRFVYAYRRLARQFASEFGKYYWGIYCK